MAEDDITPPASTASMTVDLIIRQRDEALARLAEIEPMAEGFVDVAAEMERCRDLLRRLAVILGVQEFESLEEVAMKKVAMLDAMMKAEIAVGLKEAARVAASSVMQARIAELEEQVQRLQARK